MTTSYGKTYNLDSANYSAMSMHDACFDARGCSGKGVAVHQVSVAEVIATKNGVELRKITLTSRVHFEIYIDGSFLYRYHSEKTAKSMWKDFAG